MTRVSIENLIQLLAMIGIIGSLIFVGLEMRQSQIIALAAQSQARASMLLERVGVYTEANLDYQSLTFENSYDTNLSTIEAAQRNTFHQAWFLFENDYEQYSLGLMSEEIWSAKLNGINRLFNRCEARGTYEVRKPTFPESFLRLISTIPDECKNE
tara:strand:- start:13 stop:480 length:468 start_codon:yes stop_codon:yes gene_type:complete